MNIADAATFRTVAIEEDSWHDKLATRGCSHNESLELIRSQGIPQTVAVTKSYTWRYTTGITTSAILSVLDESLVEYFGTAKSRRRTGLCVNDIPLTVIGEAPRAVGATPLEQDFQQDADSAKVNSAPLPYAQVRGLAVNQAAYAAMAVLIRLAGGREQLVPGRSVCMLRTPLTLEEMSAHSLGPDATSGRTTGQARGWRGDRIQPNPTDRANG